MKYVKIFIIALVLVTLVSCASSKSEPIEDVVLGSFSSEVIGGPNYSLNKVEKITIKEVNGITTVSFPLGGPTVYNEWRLEARPTKKGKLAYSYEAKTSGEYIVVSDPSGSLINLIKEGCTISASPINTYFADYEKTKEELLEDKSKSSTNLTDPVNINITIPPTTQIINNTTSYVPVTTSTNSLVTYSVGCSSGDHDWRFHKRIEHGRDYIVNGVHTYNAGPSYTVQQCALCGAERNVVETTF